MSTSFSEYLKFSLLRICLLVGLFVLGKIEASAQVTRTFLPNSGSWTQANNWSPIGTPGVTDILIFPSSTTSVTNIPESASVASIQIEGNSGEIRFSNSNQGINGENFISISNSLNILSGKTLLLGIGNGQRRLSLLVPINAIAKVDGTINLDGRTSANQQGIIVQGTMDLGPNGKITNDSGFLAYFDLESGGTLKIGSSQGINTSGATGNIQTSTRIFSTGGNYEYSGTANQATGNALPSTLNSLIINNSGTAGNNQVTLSANKIISSALTITSGVLDVGVFALTNSGSSSNFSIGSNGTLRIGGANNFPSGFQTVSIQCSSTVNYYANGNQTIAGVNYGNLILSGSGIKTFQTSTQQICSNFTLSGTAQSTAVANLGVGGSLTIGPGSTFSAGSFTHSIGGNWINSGTFNSGSSTINFTSSSAASIGTSNFNHVTFSGSGIKTATGNLTISGNLIITNNFSAQSFVHTLSGNFTNSGSFSVGTSSFVFDRAGDQSISSTSFYKIQLKGSGNKFFLVSTSISELLEIEGSALARLGSQNHTALKFFIGGNGQVSGTYGSTLSTATYKSSTHFGSTDLGILTVQTSSLSCSTGTWLGTSSTDWNTPSNWCNGIIPTSTIDVTIPAEAINQPLIGLGGGIARNILIQSGASLTITGANLLEVFGNWSPIGTFNPGTSSSVEFKGSTNNSINGGSFANLIISGTGTKTISTSLSISGNILVNNLTTVFLTSPNSFIVNSGKTFEISATASFSTNGILSKIILAPGSIFLNRSVSNPRLEIQQVFTGSKGWRMIGSPITATYATLTSGLETQGFPGSTNPTLQPNLIWWDETDMGTSLQAWRQPSQLSSPVTAGRGHYLYLFNGAPKPSPATGNYTDALPKTISVTGTEVNLASSSFDFGVTFTPRDSNLVAQSDTLIEVNQADEGFNLIANPTASVLDWDAGSGWTKTNVDGSIYIWDPATESFLTWNGSIGSLGNGRIAPFQAFWIRTNAANPSLQLNGNAAKTLTTPSFFGRKNSEETPNIHLLVAGENLSAESFISFGQDGKEGIDPKDAFQLESLAEDWLLLYTYGSLNSQTPLAINYQPEIGQKDQVIPLHLAASKGGQRLEGNYLLEWTLPEDLPEGISVTLMDHISQKAIDMNKESAHAFRFEAPSVPNARLRNKGNEITLPQALIFQSPFAGGEVNSAARQVEVKPQRPFTIYISSSIGSEIGYLPDVPKLFAPAPNPFSSQTNIRFYLPVAGRAEIQILDLLGKVVGSFPSQNYEVGIQSLDWIPSAMELPSGMYIIRLTTSNYQLSQKLIKN